MENKKYYLYDKDQLIKMSEDELVGKTIAELEVFLNNYQVQKLHTHECVFILKKHFFGIFTVKLYLYLTNEKIHDYYIGI